ncbi:MAG: transglutaminase domain-containing protein [Desulfobacteraceae bacterium]|nr:transglutaminase domain-containing protein [Desulfobacteraceae bacterium]
MFGIAAEGSEDMTKFASVPLERPIRDLARLKKIVFEVSGIDLENIPQTDRQSLKSNLLSINQESPADLPEHPNLSEMKDFLVPTLFIQSDNPEILELVHHILTSEKTTQTDKVRKISDWIYRSIEKRPVLSLPDALSTLKNRMGDCNEHAALFAAMSRAAGIPCRIEAGLAYLNGSFYYHAWNSVYLGKWITVDSVFNQFPADVGHIALADGENTLDLVGVIGKIGLKLVEP